MNITFLIGNGFDLNIGMKTRYSDFYDYYVGLPSSNELIKALKEDIDKNYENWSDGDTDKVWWEMIGERIKSSNCRLIIFSKGKEIKVNQEYKQVGIERGIKAHFLSKTNVEQEQWKDLEAKIFVGYNTNIFNAQVEEKEVYVKIEEVFASVE